MHHGEPVRDGNRSGRRPCDVSAWSAVVGEAHAVDHIGNRIGDHIDLERRVRAERHHRVDLDNVRVLRAAQLADAGSVVVEEIGLFFL